MMYKIPILCTNFSLNFARSEEHTSELQSRGHLVCRLLLEKKKVPENALWQLIIIGVVSGLATISVSPGPYKGSKVLSQPTSVVAGLNVRFSGIVGLDDVFT